MLKIYLDSRYASKVLDKKTFIDYPNERFNRVKNPDWFSHQLVKDIISDIDNSDVVLDEALRNRTTGRGYNASSISGGSKSLILMYELKDKIILAKMGDNCFDFVERIASEFEKEGRDLTIVAERVMMFNFKYINKIHYMNYNITCTSTEEIEDKIYPLWYRDYCYKGGDGDD